MVLTIETGRGLDKQIILSISRYLHETSANPKDVTQLSDSRAVLLLMLSNYDMKLWLSVKTSCM